MTDTKRVIEGNLKIGIKEEGGMLLTENHGFTIQEEANKVLSFDKYWHDEYGSVLLFGDQVYFIKFWDTDDLIKARNLLNSVIDGELERRGYGGNTSP